MLKVTFQTLENYARHNCETGHYWKFKGGDTVFVKGIDSETTREYRNAIAMVNIIHGSNDGWFQRYVRSVELVPEDALSYEESLELEYEGKILHPDPRYTLDELEKLCFAAEFPEEA